MRLSSNLPLWMEDAARVSAVALGFSIPISVALDNALLALVLLFWLASGNYRGKLAHIAANRVALAALALFGLLLVGLAYGTREPGDGMNYLGKYADLAFVPLFATLFASERTRRHAWHALAAALALTLALSYLVWGGIVTGGWCTGLNPQNLPMCTPLDPSIFKKYLTQNVLLAFGACLFYSLGRSAQSARARYAWFSAAVLAALNVALLSKGRTGQLLLGALAIHAAYQRWRWRGALVMLAAALAAAGFLMFTHTASGERAMLALREWQAWQPGRATDTSVGARLEFYRNGLQIAAEHPLIGTGTGSFPKVYAEHVAGTAMEKTVNPHHEYINITVQLGLVGLAFMLYLFYCEWRCAAQLASASERELARALVITFVLGCLFNSLLLDHVEGLFFAWTSGLLFAELGADRGARPA